MKDFVFPADVDGWLSEEEGRALTDLAARLRVLEIGSYCGRSTICLAQSAASVDCIDTFQGTGTSKPKDTLAEFEANLERYGVSDNVTAHRGPSVPVCSILKTHGNRFDLVFIDGSHDFHSVMADVRAALPLLRLGGLLAFHDYRRPRDPEVTQAVDRLIAHGAVLLGVYDTLAVVDPRSLKASAFARPEIFIGMPHYGQIDSHAARAMLSRASWRPTASMDIGSSFLTDAFNTLWCAALNQRKDGVRYFAMLHADIAPAPGWVDILLDELTRLNAGVVSAVSPIKDVRGLTSTGIDDPDTRWEPLRRLTMREVHRLPETFDAEDAGHPGHTLLVNTGCFLADLSRPWAQQICFEVHNEIVCEGGVFRPRAIPEDWDFSRQLRQHGVSVYATRKVRLAHRGTWDYRNDLPWGAWDVDRAYHHKVAAG